MPTADRDTSRPLPPAEIVRALMQDLLRLGLAGSVGYANRVVSRLQLEYIVNPYGRQPPHILIFPDGRAEPMTPFQIPVPGYGPDVLAIELLGTPGVPPTDDQLGVVRVLGAEVRRLLEGKVAFAGQPELVRIATAALAPEDSQDDEDPTSEDEGQDIGDESPEEATQEGEEANPPPATFLQHEKLGLASPISRPRTEPVVFSTKPSSAQDIFDILGTPPDRRSPLAPGSIFNAFGSGRRIDPSQIRLVFAAPGTREIERLVVIPSHDPSKPEPTEPQAYTLAELRKNDQRLGMSEFRAHYILAKNGELIPGRSLELAGNSWPGKNEGAIQIVLAGNGRTPTPAQRRTLYEYGVVMRRHYERPLKGAVRDILFGQGLLGLNPNGVMEEKLANAALIEAPLPQGAPAAASSHAV